MTDRLSGLFCVLFSAALVFYLIPTQVETVEYGAIRPKTMPQILAVLLGIFGAALMIRPADGSDLQPAPWGRFTAVVIFLVGGVWCLSRFGFAYVAPPLALVLMLIMGERRIIWIALGALVMPGVIWAAITLVLQRPLP